MTIDELDDLAAADEAERFVGGNRKVDDVFGSSLSTPSLTPPSPASDGGFKTYEELGQMDAARNAATLDRLKAAKPVDPIRDIGEEYAVKAAGPAITHGFDVLEAAGAPVMYGVKKLLGSGPNDERALAGSIAKPIDNIWTGAKNLYGGVKELLGGDPTPIERPKFGHDENLTAEHVKAGVEDWRTASDPNASTWERVKAGAKLPLRVAGVFASNAPSAMRGLSKAAGAAERGLASAGGRAFESLADLAPASKPFSRRGVLNLGSNLTPDEQAYKRVADMADEIAGVKNHLDPNLPQHKEDALRSMMAPAEASPDELARYAAMNDADLRKTLSDNLKLTGRREKGIARQSIEDISAGGLEAGESVPLAAGVARSVRGLSEATVSKMTDDAIALAKAYQRNPTWEAENAFLDALGDLKNEGKKGALNDQGVRRVMREIGLKPTDDKGKNIKAVEAWLETARNETPAGAVPTSPKGMEAADDLEAARLAEEAASGPVRRTAPEIPATAGRTKSLNPADDIPILEPFPSTPYGPTEPIRMPRGNVAEKTWYHGSGTGGLEPGRLDANASAVDSLFGEGVYLTDNPSIAGGYANARGSGTGEKVVYRAKVNPKNVLDLEQPAPADVRQAVEDVSRQLTEHGTGLRYNDALKTAQRNPNATSEELYTALTKDMADYSYGEGVSRDEMSNITQAIRTRLSQAGYDALTHTGGRRTGNNPHQVMIVLDPSDTAMTGRPNPITEFAPDLAPGGSPSAGAEPPPSPTAPGGGGLTYPPERIAPGPPQRWQAPPPSKIPPVEPIWEPGNPPPGGGGSSIPRGRPIPPRGERNDTGFAVNMIDSLENAARKANNPAGRQLAEKGREIVNYGETRAAIPVKRSNDLAARLTSTERQEVAELFTPEAYKMLGADRILFGKFQANVDGNAGKMLIHPSETRLAPGGQAFADDYVRGMKEIGDEAKALGVINVKGRPVQPAEGRRFIQHLDPSAKEWMVDGNPDFGDLVDELHKVRPDKTIESLRDALTTFAQQPLDRPAPIEFVRDLEMMPAAFVGRDGTIKPILRHIPIPHANSPASPTASSIHSQWMRMGGIKYIGQDVTEAIADGVDSLGNIVNQKLGPALAAGGPDVVTAAEGMLSAIYHRPVKGTLVNTLNTAMADTPLMKSRSTLAQSLRSLNRIFPAMNLSRVWAVSSPQTAGEVAAVTGFGNYGKSLMEVARRHGMAADAAEQAGAIQRKFLEAGSDVYDQHRLLESVLNANANRFPTEKLNDFVKDLNDTIAFTAGKFKGEEMLAKGAKESDFLIMDEMNLPESVKDVFRFPGMYDDAAKADAVNSFGRSVAKETQFHAKNPAMKGRFENDQVLKYIIPYQSYSINTLKRTAKDFERVWRAAAPKTASATGFAPLDFSIDALKRLDPRNLGREPVQNALKRLATRVVGMEVAGEVVADISSAGQGKDPLRRDRSLLARGLENLSYVGWLGPLHAGFDWATAWMLGSDPEAQKRSLTGQAGSRVPEVGNPFLDAAYDAGNKLRKGDVGGALWELGPGQMPIVSGLGRASGAMAPVGEKPKKPNFRDDILDQFMGGMKKPSRDDTLDEIMKDMGVEKPKKSKRDATLDAILKDL